MRIRLCPVKIESQSPSFSIAGTAVVSLTRWLKQVGVTTCTAWRWRKRGWLKTVNIAGRQYLTQEALDEFQPSATTAVLSKKWM